MRPAVGDELDPILLIIAAGMSAGLVVYAMGRRQRTFLLNRRARHRHAAREALGLKEVVDAGAEPGREPMEGMLDGFYLRMDVLVEPTGGRLREPGQRETVRMRTRLSGLYDGVEIRQETILTRPIRDMPTGDPDTDRELFVVGPEYAVAAIMNAAGRVTLRQAVRSGLWVRDGCLEGRLAGQPSASDMVELAQTLVRYTRRLERTESVAEALAENANDERRPEIRSRCWTLLLDRHRFGGHPAAKAVAEALLRDASLPEGRVRAAEFLRRDDVLRQCACDATADAHVRTLALRALVELTNEPTMERVMALLPVFSHPPQAADTAYFEQAVRAVVRAKPGQTTALPPVLEGHVLDCLETFGDRAEALIRLLSSHGSVRAVPVLAALPRSLKAPGRRAIANIQSRRSADVGALALTEVSNEGGLSHGPEGGAMSEGAGLWALVPAKAFIRAKSRLAGALGPEERATLSRSLLAGLLTELAHDPVDGILVVTDSREVADLATQHGARVIADPPVAGLAAVVAAGVDELSGGPATSVLVVMGDLPLFARGDARAMFERLASPDTIVVAPDRHGKGVNAVMARLPLAIRLPFGREDSFDAHLRAAEQGPLQVGLYQSEGTGLDVDSVEDLTFWRARGVDAT